MQVRKCAPSVQVVANARERQRPQIDAKTPHGRACRDQDHRQIERRIQLRQHISLNLPPK